MDLFENLLQSKIVFINLVKYGFPTAAIILSLLSYIDSRKANKVQGRLIELEEKLKKYELEDKEKEREEDTIACVEARIINVSKNKYRLKVWNSGKATAYNVNFDISIENKSVIWKDKVPYEFLESGKSFEEVVTYFSGISSKFKVTTTWMDNNGKYNSKEQIVSF